MDVPVYGRLAAYGQQLIEIHHNLRERLASLRDGFDESAVSQSPGSESSGPESSGSPSPRSESSGSGIREHCAAFCSALSRHHRAEDGTAFPKLAERHPELRPVLDELRNDHDIVADILRRLDAVLTSAAEIGAVRVRSELDGLTALLESHFVYEEKKLVDALNALDGGTDLLAFSDVFDSRADPGLR